MAYQNSIPQATDVLSDSQADILNNFAAIKTLVDVNHVTFDVTGQGKHKFIEFPVQAVTPTIGASEVGLYCKTSALTGVPELTFSHQSATDAYEFTAAIKNAQGYTILPSGIILKWGSGVANANTTTTVSFAVGTAFTTVYNVQATRVGTTGDTGILYVQSFTTTTLTIFNTADSTKTFYYTVIGV